MTGRWPRHPTRALPLLAEIRTLRRQQFHRKQDTERPRMACTCISARSIHDHAYSPGCAHRPLAARARAARPRVSQALSAAPHRRAAAPLGPLAERAPGTTHAAHSGGGTRARSAPASYESASPEFYKQPATRASLQPPATPAEGGRGDGAGGAEGRQPTKIGHAAHREWSRPAPPRSPRRRRGPSIVPAPRRTLPSAALSARRARRPPPAWAAAYAERLAKLEPPSAPCTSRAQSKNSSPACFLRSSAASAPTLSASASFHSPSALTL